MLKAVIFDLDQTLIDSLPRFYHVFNQSLGKRGKPPLDWSTFLVEYAKDTLDRFIGNDPAAVDDFWTEFLQAYTEADTSKDMVLEGAEDTLKSLKSRGIRIGVVTGRLTGDSQLWEELQHFGLEKYVDIVMAKRKGPKGVEHFFSKATTLRIVMDVLRVSPSEAVVVGDYHHDMKSAKTVGALAVGVLTGHMTQQQLEEAGADYTLGHVGELTTLLNEKLHLLP